MGFNRTATCRKIHHDHSQVQLNYGMAERTIEAELKNPFPSCAADFIAALDPKTKV